jgi:hypothetical protein
MKSGGALKSVILLFAAVLVLYFAGFQGIEFLRHRKGPWQVQFASEAEGASVTIAQPAMGISPTRIRFPGETGGASNFVQQRAMDDPRGALPFGRIVYADLTALPGVVTLDLFGHEIELSPRVLVINGRQVSWSAGTSVELFPTNKPATPPKSPKGWKG